jgi:hypothetical protein
VLDLVEVGPGELLELRQADAVEFADERLAPVVELLDAARAFSALAAMARLNWIAVFTRPACRVPGYPRYSTLFL